MPSQPLRRRRRESPEQIARSRRRHIVLLALLVCAVFASSLFGGFVWTDRGDLLLGQHRLESLADLPAAMTETRDAFRSRHNVGETDTPAGGSWQPLTLLSNTLSWSIWGDCAFCFHVENVLLHLIVVIGLYVLGRHVLSQQRHGVRMAAWSAALYAVHPGTVSTVAWIGGRPYLLAAALGIWALVLFTHLQATSKSQQGHVLRWRLGMAGLAAGAMLAHETAYLLPLLAVLIAGFESKARGRSALFGIAPQRLIAIALLCGVLATILLYRVLVMGGIGFSGSYPADGLFANAGTALRHFWYLVEHSILPGEPVISDAWAISPGWGVVETLALLGVIALGTAILIGLKLGQPVAFAAGWLVLWLIPGSGIFPSDHYHTSQTLYLASWGIALAVGYGLFLLWRPLGRQLMPGSEAVVYAPFLIVLGVMTALSNARWWTHDGLFQSEIAHDPHYMEGRMELAKSALERGDHEQAITHALTAIETAHDKSYTGYWSPRDTYLTLARAQWALGMTTEAARNFETALEFHPNDAELLYWRGVSRMALEQFDAAEADLQQALQLRQPFPEAAADLGVLLARRERYIDAYPLLSAALDQGLSGFDRHASMALVMIDAGQLVEAAQQLEKALALREDADTRARLAWVSWKLGRHEKATADINMALQLEEESSDYVLDVHRTLSAGPPTEPEAVGSGESMDRGPQ